MLYSAENILQILLYTNCTFTLSLPTVAKSGQRTNALIYVYAYNYVATYGVT